MADSASRQVEAAERLRKFKSVTLYGVSAVATLCALVLLLNKVRAPPLPSREFYDQSFQALAQQGQHNARAAEEPAELRWTASSICSHFKIASLAQLRWSKPVMTRDVLVHSLGSDAHVLQVPVAHAPPGRLDIGAVVSWGGSDEWEQGRDLTLREVLEALVAAGSAQGIMLMFQDPRMVKRALSPAHVYQEYGKLTGPVFIYAELLQGPGKRHPAMASILVPPHVSESFKQALPDLKQEGFHPHPALDEKPTFVPFSPQAFLEECKEILPGAFLVAAWSQSAPCPANYMPHARRRLLSNFHGTYAAAHMSHMEKLLDRIQWQAGVALAVEICHVKSSRTHWRGILERREAAVPHEDTAAYASAPLHARDPWLLFLSGTLTPQSGVHLRESFRPQSVMLNVTDLEGRRVVV